LTENHCLILLFLERRFHSCLSPLLLQKSKTRLDTKLPSRLVWWQHYLAFRYATISLNWDLNSATCICSLYLSRSQNAIENCSIAYFTVTGYTFTIWLSFKQFKHNPFNFTCLTRSTDKLWKALHKYIWWSSLQWTYLITEVATWV